MAVHFLQPEHPQSAQNVAINLASQPIKDVAKRALATIEGTMNAPPPPPPPLTGSPSNKSAWQHHAIRHHVRPGLVLGKRVRHNLKGIMTRNTRPGT
eukprot:1057974-Rhodomonas_salina.5